MRSRVSIVIRLPSRSRCTSLPSFTARRPNVDSAMSAWRQNSEIWLRIWSFFIKLVVGPIWWAAAGGAPVLPSCAQQGNASLDRSRPVIGLRGANGSRECAPNDRLSDEAIHSFFAWRDGLLRFARLFQPPLDVIFLFEFTEFRGDEADHHDLVALWQKPKRLEAAGALGIVFEEIAVVIGAGQHGLRHRLIAAG